MYHARQAGLNKASGYGCGDRITLHWFNDAADTFRCIGTVNRADCFFVFFSPTFPFLSLSTQHKSNLYTRGLGKGYVAEGKCQQERRQMGERDTHCSPDTSHSIASAL